jgi:O-antigen/teichoic acid export membrane protein
LEGAILGFGLGVVALYFANALSVRRDLHREQIDIAHQSIRREDWRLLFTYSIPATLSALTVAPVFFVIRSMLVSRSGYAELGIFEAADQWKVIILFIPTTVSQIVLPILSSLLDVHKFKKTLVLNILLIAVVSTVIALAVSLLSPYIMPLYGQSFTDLMPLTLLAMSTVFSAVSNVIEMSIYSRDKMWTCFGLNMIWAVLLIGLSELFLSQNMGASALALAVLLSYLLKTIYIGIYMMFLLKKDNSDE